jgi:hypothetical protein
MPGEAVDDLDRRLKGQFNQVHCIGDALAPRSIDAAIFEGDRLARRL